MFKNWTDFWYAITETNKYCIADEMCLIQIQYANAYNKGRQKPKPCMA